MTFLVLRESLSCEKGPTAKIKIVLQLVRQSEHNMKISQKMLYKSKERPFFKKGEWCASSFLLLNTVKQSEPSYLASGVQRAIVPAKVNNDQDANLQG